MKILEAYKGSKKVAELNLDGISDDILYDILKIQEMLGRKVIIKERTKPNGHNHKRS